MDTRSAEVVTFTRGLLNSGDLAPNYPVLREIIRLRGWDDDDEQALWFLLLYVAYHHIPSALAAVRLLGDRRTTVERVAELAPALNALPVTVPRRVVSGHVAEYLIGILDSMGEPTPLGFSTFFHRGVVRSNGDPPERRFWRFFARWRELPGHRMRWIVYEMARTLRYVRNWRIRAHSVIIPRDRTANPNVAISRLYLTKVHTKLVLNRMADHFRNVMILNGMVLDWEEIDILLVKADLFLRGRYYVGYGLDEMLAHANRLEGFHPDDHAVLLSARAASFDAKYLGEVSGWSGVRRDLLRAGYYPRILRTPEKNAQKRFVVTSLAV